jgi:hypothetical protein
MMRLVQIQNVGNRRVALVEEPHLKLLANAYSVYDLANAADAKQMSLSRLTRESVTDETVNYDDVYSGKSAWKLLPPIDHPREPSRCLISGTGLTHLGSAKNRQAMHSASEAEMNDSMKIFKWGVEGGKPAPGKIGISPEWFYKGSGAMLRAHNEPLDVPSHAEDGGEEAEIAGVYFVGANGAPRRIGMAIGNEFSDHKFEKKNYLNLAGSKLRTCALGPELMIDPDFQSVPGTVKIERGGKTIWSQEILTGEKEMCHSLANIEHHHFKFEGHRRPGDVHVHYFGACSLSFGAGVLLDHGDWMEVAFNNFGRPLRNFLHIADRQDTLITINSLG